MKPREHAQLTGAKLELVIKRASAYDAKRIAVLLDDWFKEASLAWPAPQEGPMMQWVLDVINNGFVAMAEMASGGRLFGVAGITPAHLPWTTSGIVARDQFFYVPPYYRHCGAADALMKALKIHCAKRNWPLVMHIISGYTSGEERVGASRLERWYGLQGGHYVGGCMVYGLSELVVEPKAKQKEAAA